ncbi:hypothetical protein ES703_99229 [subsurface metagenome]
MIPFEFRRIQAAKLADLTKLSSNPELRGLLNSISALIGKHVSEKLKRPESQIEREERLKQEEKRKAEVESKIQEKEQKKKKEEIRKAAESERKRIEEEKREVDEKRMPEEEEAKRRAAEEERQQQEKITSLYEQAQEQTRLHQWEQAQEKMKEIQALDSKFADPKGISTKAEKELKRKAELLDIEPHKEEAQERLPITKAKQKEDEKTANDISAEKILRSTSKQFPLNVKRTVFLSMIVISVIVISYFLFVDIISNDIVPESLELNLLRLDAKATPPEVSPGQKSTIIVTVRDAQGHFVRDANVRVGAGGGKFLPREDTPYNPRSRLQGPYSKTGITNIDGKFLTWWVCNPCAKSYSLGVEAWKEGYLDAARIEITIQIR